MSLCDTLREELLNLPHVRVYTQPGAALTAFNVEGMASQETAGLLNGEDIAVRAGLHCAPGVHRFLGTLTCGAVRVSPGLMNSTDDMKHLLSVIAHAGR